MKWFLAIALLLSLAICVISVDIEDIEEEIEDAREKNNEVASDEDNDDEITLGELKELEERLQRDPVPGRRRRRRRRRSWRGRRTISRVGPYIPHVIRIFGKRDESK